MKYDIISKNISKILIERRKKIKKWVDKYIFLNFGIHEYWIYQGYNISDILNLDWEIISQSEDEKEVKKK